MKKKQFEMIQLDELMDFHKGQDETDGTSKSWMKKKEKKTETTINHTNCFA